MRLETILGVISAAQTVDDKFYTAEGAERGSIKAALWIAVLKMRSELEGEGITIPVEAK